MNDIETFLNKLKSLTGVTFRYQQEIWAFPYKEGLEITHNINSTLSGFGGVKKDTLEELIDSFELIEKQVLQLIKVGEIQKQLDCKLIGGTHESS